ncbi:MAG: SAM-dependent methyltransferase, partial [Ilumatobacteraceae bacterium]|nr:SAM-dependent methyltransferase [Ilumatobacteraceae bacterium]
TAAIAAAGGAIPFSEYMRLALYGEGGFYTTGGRAGRRGGDFITSPEVGPLFGTVIARALDAWWKELGSPSRFDVVECGAGPGTLARSILAAQPECANAMRYIAVEISASQRALHPQGVESRETMPDGPITGVILANELLDNLPFRLFVFDGSWMEAFVAQVTGGQFVEVLRTPDVVPSCLPQTAPHGSRAPVQDAAASWVRDCLSKIDQGRLLLFDYCSASTAEIAITPWREWLRTYRDQGRGTHYLSDPGSQDITSQVMLDQLPSEAITSTQADFLTQWGIDELVDEGSDYWESMKNAPDVAAMKMRSRSTEAKSLTDSSGLGSFDYVIWTVIN